MPGGRSPGPSIKRPKAYEAIKAKLIKGGLGEDEAQTRAAKISNASAKRAKAKKRKGR